jgi:hypothetical protein
MTLRLKNLTAVDSKLASDKSKGFYTHYIANSADAELQLQLLTLEVSLP